MLNGVQIAAAGATSFSNCRSITESQEKRFVQYRYSYPDRRLLCGNHAEPERDYKRRRVEKRALVYHKGRARHAGHGHTDQRDLSCCIRSRAGCVQHGHRATCSNPSDCRTDSDARDLGCGKGPQPATDLHWRFDYRTALLGCHCPHPVPLWPHCGRARPDPVTCPVWVHLCHLPLQLEFMDARSCTQEILGSLFSRRMSLSLIVGIVLSLAASFIIDFIERNPAYPPGTAYSVIFLGGFVTSLMGIWYMSKIPEPLMTEVPKIPLLDQVRSTFHDINFSRLIAFLGAWNFAVNLAAPFFTVYLLVMLDFNISVVIAFAILSQLSSVLSYGMWGRIADRFSNKSVLRVAGPLFMICILGWTFTTMPNGHPLTIPLLIALHILMGVSTAGVTLASANIGLKLAPHGSATAYLATMNIINSLDSRYCTSHRRDVCRFV